jgi:hypothetical protein
LALANRAGVVLLRPIRTLSPHNTLTRGFLMEEMRASSSETENDMPYLAPANLDRPVIAALLVQRARVLTSPLGRNVPSTQSKGIHTYVHHSSLPREAVINVLRLPTLEGRSGEQILCFAYFQEELRSVPIALADYILPPMTTRTPGGMAVVGLMGARLEVRSDDADELRRIRAFLDERLHPYALTQGSQDDDGLS